MGVNPLEYDVEELRSLGAASGRGTGGNLGVGLPYLRSLPTDDEVRPFVRDWLSELVTAGGSDGAADALAYYRFMGWLDPTAQEQLEDHLLAVGNGSGTFDDLTRADHMRSLARIARLAERAAAAEGDDTTAASI
jgi:archaellum component FlaD/FlaE